MTDYIGRYVKRFESGTIGSLAFVSCGNDWGLSCGSYQLTLRWGNSINFLKKYFPSESKALFFNTSKKDFVSKNWPGYEYCSSPDAVKSIWQKCYNKVGATKFFEYEHSWIEANYYTPIKNKIKSILDLDTADRAFQECFWAWSVHRGSGGACKEFKEILSENEIESLDYVDKEELFDLIYDKRYSYAKTNRYKKGITNSASERETLRPLLGEGTFSGKVLNIDSVSEDESIIKVNPINGSLKVVIRDDTLNVRSSPDFGNNIVGEYSYGKILTVVGITEDNKFYKLSDGNYISTNTKYVQFTKDSNEVSFKIRINADTIEIKKEPNDDSAVVGTVMKNGVYTILSEENGYGRLKSGAGWISLDSKFVIKLI